MTSVFLSGKQGWASEGCVCVCFVIDCMHWIFSAGSLHCCNTSDENMMPVKLIVLTLNLHWRSYWEKYRKNIYIYSCFNRNCQGGMNSCMFMSHICVLLQRSGWVISASVCSWWALLLCVPWGNGLHYKAWNPLSAFQIKLGLLQNPAEKWG